MLTSRQTRRAVCAGLVGLTVKAERPVTGGFVFESQTAGHAIRDRRAIPAPRQTVRKPLVIVGGGMAGLCAAWWLEKRGFRDFVILEMEKEAGGNSRFGQNEVSAYPWGAHYVPVPNTDAVLVRELFTELGLFVDGRWDERWLCHSPQERLFLHGRWQEGIEPDIGLTAADRKEFQAFEARIREFRDTKQFRIPMATGAPPDSPLDKLSFRKWLETNGFRSEYLHWLADYSTRDDYGASSVDTSAWAGIHYFAARDHEEKGPFTWPEGNGWILRRLLKKLENFVQTGHPVLRIGRTGTKWEVQTPQTLYQADCVIYAAPAFLLPYLDPAVPQVKTMNWSPWIVSNLTLDRMPAEKGIEPAWDNVIYRSPALGYVVSTHQNVQIRTEKTVLTHYWALSGAPSAHSRRDLLANDWGVWKERILTDLERAHRDIRECVTRIDIFRNGHAMIRPTPGFLANPERKSWEKGRERFYYGHADVSGFSLFEEAQYRGVEAAGRALRALGR
ncbi:MAG TPA: FAD-dependent oxidoreductase [Bryobacteraceae bacterium]|nr:FAD-dependent oxidoreductase [Bryobacteraceae bacterium]